MLRPRQPLLTPIPGTPPPGGSSNGWVNVANVWISGTVYVKDIDNVWKPGTFKVNVDNVWKS